MNVYTVEAMDPQGVYYPACSDDFGPEEWAETYARIRSNDPNEVDRSFRVRCGDDRRSHWRNGSGEGITGKWVNGKQVPPKEGLAS